MALVFWDTNLFIYLVEPSPVFGEQVRQLRLRMLARGDGLATSALTYRRSSRRTSSCRNDAVYKQYLSVFSQPEIRVLKFDLEAAGHYAYIRQDKSIQAPGMPYNLPARRRRASIYSSANDDRLSRKNIPGINFITSLARAPI